MQPRCHPPITIHQRTIRCPDSESSCSEAASAPVSVLSSFIHKLIKCWVDIVGKLYLCYRCVALGGQANAKAYYTLQQEHGLVYQALLQQDWVGNLLWATAALCQTTGDSACIQAVLFVSLLLSACLLMNVRDIRTATSGLLLNC